MTHVFSKLFPYENNVKVNNSLSLLFISEGYRLIDKEEFYKDIFNIWNALRMRAPFNGQAIRLSVYTLFLPSTTRGVANSLTAAVGATPLESYMDGDNYIVNESLLQSILDDASIHLENEEILINNIISKNDLSIQKSSFGCFPVIISPTASNTAIEAEGLTVGNYYFAATSIDGYCEQVILKSIAKLIGLGDEFELPGTEYHSPVSIDQNQQLFLYDNLIYFDHSSPLYASDPNFKWRFYFNNFVTAPIPTHVHPGPDNTPDRTLPTMQLSYDAIDPWEGGGGFRKQMLRPAYDCINRRRIGDVSLPLKLKKIEFCKLCSLKMSNNIAII